MLTNEPYCKVLPYSFVSMKLSPVSDIWVVIYFEQKGAALSFLYCWRYLVIV